MGTKADNEEEYTEVLSRQEEESRDENIGRRTGESYQYMSVGQYKRKLGISKKNQKKGTELVEKGLIQLVHTNSGYIEGTGEFVCEFYGTGALDSYGRIREFPIRMVVSRERVDNISCSCPDCSLKSYYYHGNRNDCAYVSGMIDLAEEYLTEHNVWDATDLSGRRLMNAFQGRRTSRMISDNRDQNQSLTLEPKIIQKDGRIALGFRIGEKKLFVIKDLVHFAHNVKESQTEVYGSNTSINHGMQNFKPEAVKWLRFIFDAVEEEEKFQKRISEEVWYEKEKAKLASIDLYGWRMDRLFENMAEQKMTLDNRDVKKKYELTTAVANPKLSLVITPQKEANVFEGILATMRIPKLFNGTNSAYYIDVDTQKLNKLEPDFYDKLEPLFRVGEYGIASFCVGRRNLSDFYYNVLPEIEPLVTVVETQPQLIEQYLLPEAKFSFYLDAPQHDVTCRVKVRYGDREFSGLDLMRKNEKMDECRLPFKEQEILLSLESLFTTVDLNRDLFSCGQDEDKIYDVVSQGVEELAELGDVFCTNRFKNVNTARKPKVSVGVSISGGLLDLQVQTEDISQEELLDLLRHYRSNQKYYRLKTGEFVDMQEESLRMLIEMMETMHVSPKEFVKGKMNLPLYRTLYLDRMLEEHEEVYNTRDQVFKEIVKDMKSVNDSGYEVPERLKKTMRKYQRNGFRWMRTLEDCHFGGILADDMGLGKTLQVISVLLAARQEGKDGTSLVVCPASLVYNWGEEFEKFAPELAVTLITGKQEDRAGLIEDYRSADVLVTSYDLLKRDIDIYEGKTFLYEIIDEAQYIKNQATAASKAVKLIRSQTKFALTGTPIENRLSELWSIFDYLMPGFLYGYETFRKEFETPIVKGGDEEALHRLQKMVSPFILRRLKGDVLKDLPDKLEETRVVRFGDEQQKLYDAQVVQMKKELASGDESDFNKKKLQILAELTKLRQVCCDPHLCYENYRGESAKRESCLDLIESAVEGGHKILLFSQFTSMLALLEESLKERGLSYYKITGETNKQDRLAMVKQFNEDDTPVFLISLKAGGVGLNLTGADVVIHYDPWWNLAVQNQATDRAHRIGQTRKVTVYKMIAKGTIEEKIQKLQETKKDLADSIINGDNTGMSSLSKEELLELLEIG